MSKKYQAAEAARLLDRHHVRGRLDHAQQTAVATARRAHGTEFALGEHAAAPAVAELRGVVFFDLGNVWGPDIPGAVTGATFDITQLKYAVGAGLRWNSPFGPLRIDYGINPAQKAGESFGQLQFSVGSTF